MPDATHDELLQLTQTLLDAIARGDWQTYERLCDPSLTAFEPEAAGNLVEGLAFHQFYFDLPRAEGGSVHTTIVAPHVRRIGSDAAIVCYTRLVQRAAEGGAPQTASSQETRVWQLKQGHWRHVHFHRSM